MLVFSSLRCCVSYPSASSQSWQTCRHVEEVGAPYITYTPSYDTCFTGSGKNSLIGNQTDTGTLQACWKTDSMKGTSFTHFIKAILSCFRSYMTFIWYVLIWAKSLTIWLKICLDKVSRSCLHFRVQYSHILIKSWFVSSHCDAVISTWFYSDLRKKTLNVIIIKPGAIGAKINKKFTVLCTLLNNCEACLCDAMINANSCVNTEQVISLSLFNSFDCHLSN